MTQNSHSLLQGFDKHSKFALLDPQSSPRKDYPEIWKSKVDPKTVKASLVRTI